MHAQHIDFLDLLDGQVQYVVPPRRYIISPPLTLQKLMKEIEEGEFYASETRTVGASRQATDIRGQADHMSARHGIRSLRHGQFRLILGGSYR